MAIRYALHIVEEVKDRRRRGSTRISSKNQITIPVDALTEAGLSVGDLLRARADGPGRIVLDRKANLIEEFSGRLSGVYGPNYLDDLRREWG